MLKINKIINSKEKALKGICLTKKIISLLEIPVGSKDDDILRKTAFEVAKIKTNNTGYVWSAIGADYKPCIMNCNFGTFEKNGILLVEN